MLPGGVPEPFRKGFGVIGGSCGSALGHFGSPPRSMSGPEEVFFPINIFLQERICVFSSEEMGGLFFRWFLGGHSANARGKRNVWKSIVFLWPM